MKIRPSASDQKRDKTRSKYKKTSIGKSPNTKKSSGKRYRGQG